jgi:hypothetical protein
MPEPTFARCPCGTEWIAQVDPGRLLVRCPECETLYELDRVRRRVRYIVDVPASGFGTFMAVVRRPGFRCEAVGDLLA